MTPDTLEILGRNASPVLDPALTAAVAAEITPQHLATLSSKSTGPNPTEPLKRIRQIHHNIARLLAAGHKPVQVSEILGFSQSRISVLQRDPSFKELIAHYTAIDEAAFSNVRDRMVSLGLDAAAELHERIAERPEEVSNSALIDVLKTSLDRGGHAPVTQSKQTVEHTLSPEALGQLKAAVNSSQQGRIFNAAPSEIGEIVSTEVSTDSGPGVGIDSSQGPVQGAEECSGAEGQGPGV